MSSATPGSTPSLFEIKSAQLPLVALLLKSSKLNDVARELQQRYGDIPDFFSEDPLLIDLSALHDTDEALDWSYLIPLLKRYRLVPVAVRGGNARQMQTAQQAGLAFGDEASLGRAETANEAPPVQPPEPALMPALIVDKPLRSGQQVYARGRDLVVLAMVNPGAEVIADGHIHVFAPLRGKAIAGARGYADARIFAASLEAELISIAGVYRTSDNPLPANVQGKPAQVRLESGANGDKLLLEPII
ncbi:MAG: Septum site-determining protein MinC [Pseudomonadota bacterium]|jgi:septum site-determining protein MinC